MLYVSFHWSNEQYLPPNMLQFSVILGNSKII